MSKPVFFVGIACAKTRATLLFVLGKIELMAHFRKSGANAFKASVRQRTDLGFVKIVPAVGRLGTKIPFENLIRNGGCAAFTGGKKAYGQVIVGNENDTV